MNFNDNSSILQDGLFTNIQKTLQSTYDVRLMYQLMTSKTVTNTLVETSLFDDTNAIGIRTVKGSTARIGQSIRLTLRHDYSCSGNPTNTIKIKLGSNTIITDLASILIFN